MWILSFNITHDASVTLLKDGEVIFHIQEERITHKKYDCSPLQALKKVKEYTNIVDICAYTFLHSEGNKGSVKTYYKYITKVLGITIKNMVDLSGDHHILHATCGFFHSGFDDAAVMVMDGGGAMIMPHQIEVESIFTFSKPQTFYTIQQNYSGKGFIGAGQVYSAVTSYLGWDPIHCGKTMGLFSYGKENPKVKKLITDRGGVSTLFKVDHSEVDSIGYSVREYPGLKNIHKEDIAYRVQKDFEEYVLNFAIKTLELTGSKNLVWTGGCALNCVANFNLRKKLPKDVNLYVEPISGDCGISLGAAYFCEMGREGGGLPKKKQISTLYLGEKLKYDYTLINNEIENTVSPKDVATLLSEGNIVTIAQGRSESGPRALGNRSILFDPRVPNGKDIVNTVKGRESFRPFAGTVLFEHINDWFDMGGLDESPNMMYTVDVLRPEKIPAITHVDGTCRVQTLKKEQNENYYNLISEFYNITGVPILFNTSFNLAGDTIVDTMEDALHTLRVSKIEYLYLPEINKLITIKNK
jgi:carbamoyltransferase